MTCPARIGALHCSLPDGHDSYPSSLTPKGARVHAKATHAGVFVFVDVEGDQMRALAAAGSNILVRPRMTKYESP